MEPYDDIIHLSRPQSRRARMSAINRAAQFAPFAALASYEAAIRESGRFTGERKELDEEEKTRLNARLCALAERIGQKPEVMVTYFLPDEKKAGGEYVSFTGRLRKVDAFGKSLLFEDGTRILMEDIYKIEEECFTDVLPET